MQNKIWKKGWVEVDFHEVLKNIEINLIEAIQSYLWFIYVAFWKIEVEVGTENVMSWPHGETVVKYKQTSEKTCQNR